MLAAASPLLTDAAAGVRKKAGALLASAAPFLSDALLEKLVSESLLAALELQSGGRAGAGPAAGARARVPAHPAPAARGDHPRGTALLDWTCC
jgi:hypothetical protein